MFSVVQYLLKQLNLTSKWSQLSIECLFSFLIEWSDFNRYGLSLKNLTNWIFNQSEFIQKNSFQTIIQHSFIIKSRNIKS